MIQKLILVLLSALVVLNAGTNGACPPPQNVNAEFTFDGVQVTWEYNLPDTLISYNDGIPSGIWGPIENQALGVVFDLSAFPNATLEMIDFVHFSRDLLQGNSYYNLYLFDMDSSKTILKIDSLVAGDAAVEPGYETAVQLGSVNACAKVGIFIEGLTIVNSQGQNYSFPALMSDSSAYLAATNFYLLDTSDPWLASDPNYTNFFETNQFSANATNFIIDLWLNTNEGKTKISSVAEGDRFRVFRGLDTESLVQIAEVGVKELSYLDQTDLTESSYYFGVAAVCESGESDTVITFFEHPDIYTISEAKEDANQDIIPDMLGDSLYLKGVVISPNFDSATEYFIQDAQAGLRLKSDAITLDFEIGDSLFLYGVLGQVNGMTEFVLSSEENVVVSNTGNMVDTLHMSIADISETNESMLVQLENLMIVNPQDWPADGVYSNSVRVASGSDTIYLVIDPETDLDGWTAPASMFHLTGIVEEISEQYFIRPRFTSDFQITTAVEEFVNVIPDKFSLQQNYPNPFNPTTTISYQLPKAGNVNLVVYNMLGQKVRSLVHTNQKAGSYKVQFDGSGLSSGVYFYKLKAGNYEEIKKMILMQ